VSVWCKELVSQSIRQRDVICATCADEVWISGHEVIRYFRLHQSKRDQVFFEMVVTDLYNDDFNAITASDGIGGVLFRLELRSWEVIF
jgi:hypothetical protein